MNYVQGGVNAAAAVYKGYQEAANYETAAKQDMVNAQTVRVQGNAEEDRVRYDSALKMGVQRAAIAESGFSGSSASFDTLQQQSAGQLELDALTTRYKANLKALDFENQAAAENRAASTARHNANINKITSFIGGMFGGGATTDSANVQTYRGANDSQPMTHDQASAIYSDKGYGDWSFNGYGD